jgi:hypothetical protein
MYQTGGDYYEQFSEAPRGRSPAAAGSRKSTKTKKSILKKSRSRSKTGFSGYGQAPYSQRPEGVTARSVEE